MCKRRLMSALSLPLTVLMWIPVLFGQSVTAALVGTVSDNTGAVIDNVHRDCQDQGLFRPWLTGRLLRTGVQNADLQRSGALWAHHRPRQQTGADGADAMRPDRQALQFVPASVLSTHPAPPQRRQSRHALVRKFLEVVYPTLKINWMFEDFPSFVLAS